MRVLLVEDDPDLSRQLKLALADAGYAVDHAADGEEAHFLGETEPYDAIVLDLGLPKIDGVSVLERWRRAHVGTPVLILTARGAWSEKVAGFDAGADDYLTKPFGMDELLARIRAALRHGLQQKGAPPLVVSGDLRIDLLAHQVRIGERPVRLTAKEFILLKTLAIHAGSVVTHRELLQELWGPGRGASLQYLRNYVRALRLKLEAEPSHPRYVLTEGSVGYRLRQE